MDPLLALAREWGLFVLEDTCQAFGAEYRGRRAGALGDAGTYSFFPTKNFGGAGDGGLISTADDAVAERLLRVRVHGSRERYYHDEIGYNSRLDEVQAAVLRVKIHHLDTWNAERNRVASWYAEGLAGIPGVAVPVVPEGRTHIYHQYVIRAVRRDALKEHLQARGIGSMIYYPVPLHQQKCFAPLGYKDGDLPETERAALEVLALPVFAELTRDEVDEVCAAIRTFYAGRG
jgi:dTDP-4-amino-4,6-dideoxygalactose transaminase